MAINREIYFKTYSRPDDLQDIFGVTTPTTHYISLKTYLEALPVVKRGLPRLSRDSNGDPIVIPNNKTITYLLFMEAENYLDKALANLCSQILLFSNKSQSWGVITGYYSSFFSLNGLLRLQGKGHFHSDSRSPLKGHSFFLSPDNIDKHNYVFFRHTASHHRDVWIRFFEVYRPIAHLFPSQFEPLLTCTLDDLMQEVEQRNNYNYAVYIGFREVQDLNVLNEDVCKRKNLIYNIYNKLYDANEEIQTLARAARRIIFLDYLLRHISQKNIVLKQTHKNLTECRKEYINNIVKTTVAQREISKLVVGKIKHFIS